ncbi:MAG: response regulator, partial [Oligosphaeraceae bacterium]|nr:response regulator [Oligosphaeraceae bacterium]
TPIRDQVNSLPIAFLALDMPYDCQRLRHLRWPLMGIAGLTLVEILCVVLGVVHYHRRDRKAGTLCRNYWEPLCLAVFGILLTLAVAWHIRRSELQRQRDLFLRLATRSTGAILRSFAEIRKSELEGLSGYLETSVDLNRAKFIHFSRHLVKNSVVQALAWTPVVPAAAKDAFEAEVAGEWEGDFHIWQLSTTGRKESISVSPQRPVYYPVTYFCPEEGNQFTLGFDEGSDPRRRQALEQAVATRLPTATEPISLVHDGSQNGKSIIVFFPIYPYLEPERLIGLATIFLRVEKLFQPEPNPQNLLAWELHHLSSAVSGQPFYTVGEGVGYRNGLLLTQPLCEYGRVFLLQARPGVAFIRSTWHWKGLITFASGLLLTAAMTAITVLLLRHRQTLQQEVQLRTAELGASETNYRLLFENMMGAFALHEMLYDEQGKAVDYRFLEVNPAFEKMTNLRAADIIGRTVLEVLPQTERTWIDRYSQVVESGVGKSFKLYAGALKRHYKVWAFRTVKPFFATVFADVTEQVKMEEKLTLYFDTSVDLFCIFDHEGVFLRVNPQWEETLGYPVASLEGRRFAEFLHPDDVAPTMEIFADLQHTRQIRGIVNRYRHRDGSYRWLEWRASVGQESFFGSARDITERRQQELQQEESNRRLRESEEMSKRMARQAESANRAKSEFLANMSHEIRTPLNAVIGMSDMLLGKDLPEVERHYVEMISNNGEALLSLIDDILDFSRIEAGRLQLDKTDFDLWKLVDDVLSMQVYRSEEKRLGLFSKLSAEVPQWVHGDCGRLRQILLNLISNAIKFTIAGEVSVEGRLLPAADENAAADAIKLQFCIRDTGIGIPADEIKNMFLPFRQGDATITRKFGGTGLGLSICKRLAEMMGGEISLSSVQGQGTEACFSVVLAKAQREHTVKSLPPEILGPGSKILLVDQHATNCRFLSEQLQEHGLCCLSAGTGEEALSILRQDHNHGGGEDITVVVINMHLPDMDGIALGRRIMADCADARPALVLLAGAEEVLSLDDIAAFNFLTVLHKPLKHLELLRVIAGIRSPEQRQQETMPAEVAGPDFASVRGRFSDQQLRVLVVDDMAMNQNLLKAMLQKLGVGADGVANGQEALQALENHHYDLVLMDVQMPVMDGLAATRAIRDPRSSVLNHDVVVVATTAHAYQSDQEQCLQSGMNDYIAKPIRARALSE